MAVAKIEIENENSGPSGTSVSSNKNGDENEAESQKGAKTVRSLQVSTNFHITRTTKIVYPIVLHARAKSKD